MRREVTGSPRGLELEPCALELLLDVLCALHRGLLRLPDLLEVGVLPVRLCDLLLELLAPIPRSAVALLAERLALDLELNEAPVEPVHLLGLGVDLHSDPPRRLVDQIDRLVGELALGDVSMRERRGGDDGGVADVHPVVDLVALLQPAEDRDRVLDARRLHQHLLESPREGRVFLQVLAELVQSGRPGRSAAHRARGPA